MAIRGDRVRIRRVEAFDLAPLRRSEAKKENPLSPKVSADGAAGALGGHGGAQHLASLQDDVAPLPDHGACREKKASRRAFDGGREMKRGRGYRTRTTSAPGTRTHTRARGSCSR